MNLSDNIKYLKGVGPKRAELLNKELQIFTIEDLIYYFPFKYIDRSKFYKISEINSQHQHIQIRGKILSLNSVGTGRKRRLVSQFSDGSGIIFLVWFKSLSWVEKAIIVGKEYIVFGKPSVFKREINIIHPEMDAVSESEDLQKSQKLQPQYSLTEKLRSAYFSSKTIAKLVFTVLKEVYPVMGETLTENIIKKTNLIKLKDALAQVHFPINHESLAKARYRLIFEELFYIQLNLLKHKTDRKKRNSGYSFGEVGDFFNRFYKEKLPFELTNAQKRVVKEIWKDLRKASQMNRLLQGDVGSGKTLVALMCMLLAIDNSFQACLMAPTEILANQHFLTIKKMLDGLEIEIDILTGSTKQKDRKLLHEFLQNGKLKILVGTHALIEDTVVFQNLGFVVIDEQHRFGVAQRAKLWTKNKLPPHILVMTATPIPRTLAMTLYGDLDVSVIDELPPGRKSVKTVHYFENKRPEVYHFLKNQIAAGRQIYIVFPLIKESEKMDYKNLEEGYEHVREFFPLPEYKVSIVHGQMKADEKEIAMKAFVRGKTHIMVATTVIEVGVDVPNASVMLIESAERFGLSQLHQLRGRVGRGAEQSYCILMSSYKLSKEGRERLKTMTDTNDGFKISEVDLKLRGPGDLEGTQQSGIAFDMNIANLARDGQILQHARDTAEEILADDPLLQKTENKLLVTRLNALSKSMKDWSAIS